MTDTDARFNSELERQLAHALTQRGIVHVHDFRVPGNRVIFFDFVLPEPPFGVIEVKGPIITSDALPFVVNQLDALAQSAHRHLGGSARLYLAVVGSVDTKLLESLPPGVILCQGDVATVADSIATDFLAHAIRLPGKDMSPALAETLCTDNDELTQTLSQLALNLDCLFLAENRQVLENEVVHLRDEIGHQHFTAAALRVGRSVEFIIYAACRSWGVPVREPVLIGLNKLEERFGDLKSALLEYSGVEGVQEQRDQTKQNVLRKANSLTAMLNEMLFEIDKNSATAPDGKKSPINTHALLADIKKKYRHLEEVRNGIDSQKGPLKQLLDLRNSAAHASLDGEAREVERQELHQMIGFLNEVLLALSKCGTAIELNRKECHPQ